MKKFLLLGTIALCLTSFSLTGCSSSESEAEETAAAAEDTVYTESYDDFRFDEVDVDIPEDEFAAQVELCKSSSDSEIQLLSWGARLYYSCKGRTMQQAANLMTYQDKMNIRYASSQLEVNSIYAKYGYHFQNPQLHYYFYGTYY